MKPRFTIIVAVLALLLGLALLRIGQHNLSNDRDSAVVPDPTTTGPAPAPVASRQTATADVLTPPSQSDVMAYRDWFIKATLRDSTLEWKTPIDFWGKVVDQAAQPVPGAEIRFSWTDLSEAGTSELFTNSDSHGRFSLLGRTGKHLLVKVTKDGYWGIPDGAPYSFEYASPFESNWHHPDSNAPVIFRLWKPVSPERLVSHHIPLKLPNVGLPRGLNFVARQMASQGDLVARVIVSTNYLPQRIFDWQLDIQIPGGGFVETQDPQAFTAPLAGYSNGISLVKIAGTEGWSEGWKGRYYFAFGEPRQYGFMEMDFFVGWPRFYTNSTLTLTYWINTNGTPNLERNPTDQPALRWPRR